MNLTQTLLSPEIFEIADNSHYFENSWTVESSFNRYFQPLKFKVDTSDETLRYTELVSQQQSVGKKPSNQILSDQPANLTDSRYNSYLNSTRGSRYTSLSRDALDVDSQSENSFKQEKGFISEGQTDRDSLYDHSSTTQVYDISSTTVTSSLMQEIQNLPTVTSLQIQQQSDPNLEEDKKQIYDHPLYPLLSMLLEKCEAATAQPDSPPADTFEADMRSFVQRQEADNKPFFTDDTELDSLMLTALQVLRIHLVELRKVNELCKDFCSRYISCLKTKIQSDVILQDSAPSSPTGSEGMSPTFGMMAAVSNNGYPNYHGGSIVSPLGAHLSGAHMGINCYNGDGSGLASPPPGMTGYDSSSTAHLSHRHMLLDPSKQKRGVLPKKATQVMKQWLFQHLVHPYPTEDEKRQIASQTNLTLLQVNNWFINARRRILHPMLDASNHIANSGSSDTEGAPTITTNKKKKAATNRPTNNRFWPPSLANCHNARHSNSSSPALSAYQQRDSSKEAACGKSSEPVSRTSDTSNSDRHTPVSTSQEVDAKLSPLNISIKNSPNRAVPSYSQDGIAATSSHDPCSKPYKPNLAASSSSSNSSSPGESKFLPSSGYSELKPVSSISATRSPSHASPRFVPDKDPVSTSLLESANQTNGGLPNYAHLDPLLMLGFNPAGSSGNHYTSSSQHLNPHSYTPQQNPYITGSGYPPRPSASPPSQLYHPAFNFYNHPPTSSHNQTSTATALLHNQQSQHQSAVNWSTLHHHSNGAPSFLDHQSLHPHPALHGGATLHPTPHLQSDNLLASAASSNLLAHSRHF